MANYVYRTLGRKVVYSLTDESVVVVTTTATRSWRMMFPLDQIPARSSVVTTSSTSWLWIFLTSVALGLISLLAYLWAPESGFGLAAFGLLVAAFSGGLWLQSRRTQEVFYLVSGERLPVHMPRYPWEPAETFVAELRGAKIQALKRKVRMFAEDSDESEIVSYVTWLRDSGVVGDEGYRAVIGELEFGREKPGFKP